MMAILAPSSLDVQIPSMGSVAVSVISDLIDSSLQSGITHEQSGNSMALHTETDSRYASIDVDTIFNCIPAGGMCVNYVRICM